MGRHRLERGTLTIKRTVTSVNVGGKTQVIEQESAKTKSSMRTLRWWEDSKELQLRSRRQCTGAEQAGLRQLLQLRIRRLCVRGRAGRTDEARLPDLPISRLHPAARHEKMRFHDLRHSCASLLLANGVPLKQIQDWLGHSDFSTTANIYAHLDYSSKLSSAQAMVSGMPLPEAGDFGSRWEQNAEKSGA